MIFTNEQKDFLKELFRERWLLYLSDGIWADVCIDLIQNSGRFPHIPAREVFFACVRRMLLRDFE